MTDHIEILRHNAQLYFSSLNALKKLVEQKKGLPKGTDLDIKTQVFAASWGRTGLVAYEVIKPYFLTNQDLDEILTPLNIERS